MGFVPNSRPGEPDGVQQDHIDLAPLPDNEGDAWGRMLRTGGPTTAVLLILMAISPMRYQRAYLMMLVLVLLVTAIAGFRGRRRHLL
jgi:hypothetical protein